jgi:hypothetical protein
MIPNRHLPALAWLALWPAVGAAADLAKIERTIAKEPAYQTKSPRYALLVFGPQAQTRIWLVLDGDTLYVDRNGNGDLTEPAEKVAAKKEERAVEGNLSFEAGDIADGKQTHKNLTVGVIKLDDLADRNEQVKQLLAKDPNGRGYLIRAEVEMPGWKGAGTGDRVEQLAFIEDVNGLLQFAGRPQDAPIIHFGGPWQVTPFGRDRLTVGRETDLVLGVGTAGLGAGTTAWIAYEPVIPEQAYPKVEIAYPARPRAKPVRELYELKKRC